MATKKPTNCIELYKDKAGEFRWRAVARNGNIIADGSEGYVSKANVKRAATRFVKWATYVLPSVALKIVDSTAAK